MIRFAFTFSLILLVAGCQTSSRSSKPAFLAPAPQPAASAKQFWNKTAQFFMPDTNKRCAEAENQVALSRSHSDILPVNHSSNSLYRAGSIFPSLALQDRETLVSATSSTETSNPLHIQRGDSEAFQSLLRELAVMPPDKLRVEGEKLTEMITTFRDEIMDSEFEDEYLALLRKRVLPTLPKSAAPLPSTELAETKRNSSNTRRAFESDPGDELDDEPIAPPSLKRTLPNRNESIIAQSATSMPAPVYPSLTQLPSAAPAVVQTSYQASYAQNAASAGYGAGDWQTPMRAAVEQLRYAIEQTPNGRTVSNEMRLRMAETLLGNKSEAARPMQSSDEAINRFMGNQVLGFAALLDDTASDSRGKYVSAAYRFNEGLAELQNLCPIKMKNVLFVKNYFAYGQYIPHPNQEFHPGEPFIVYTEIENPTVRRAVDGFEVCVGISYEIRDDRAAVVHKRDIGPVEDVVLSPKRDYMLVIGPAPDPRESARIPTSLPPGQYYLRINMTDMNDKSKQYAEEQIPFRVVPSSGGDL